MFPEEFNFMFQQILELKKMKFGFNYHLWNFDLILPEVFFTAFGPCRFCKSCIDTSIS